MNALPTTVDSATTTSSVEFDIEKPEAVDVLGTPIFVGDVASAASWVVDRALAGAGGYVCFCNVHLFVVARHDDEVRRALAGAALAFPDGSPIAWLQRRLGHLSAARVAGPDLMARVIEDGRGFGIRHFLLGSTEDVVRRLAESLARRFPGAEIAGRLTLPFYEAGDFSGTKEAISEVRRARPDIVWLSLGCPKQELWMLRYGHELLAPALVAGVGAAFDFHAGTKQRAPTWMQRTGLEWLHRLLSEPRRLASRYARTNSEFLLLVGKELGRRLYVRHRRAELGDDLAAAIAPGSLTVRVEKAGVFSHPQSARVALHKRAQRRRPAPTLAASRSGYTIRKRESSRIAKKL